MCGHVTKLESVTARRWQNCLLRLCCRWFLGFLSNLWSSVSEEDSHRAPAMDEFPALLLLMALGEERYGCFSFCSSCFKELTRSSESSRCVNQAERHHSRLTVP